MPPVQAPAAVPLGDGVARRIITVSATSSAVSGTWTNSDLGCTFVLTGIDATATQAEPIQCFFDAQLVYNTSEIATFYWDSQSTGEGNGVWFSWRGAIPLALGEGLNLNGTSSGTIVWAALASGFIVPVY
jgi:hypothetical protein